MVIMVYLTYATVHIAAYIRVLCMNIQYYIYMLRVFFDDYWYTYSI